MKPWRWIRWKVVAALAVLAVAISLLGLDKAALSRINSAGRESRAATWQVAQLALGILAGDAELRDLLVDTARDSSRTAASKETNDASAAKAREGGRDGGKADARRVLSAKGLRCDLSVRELLAKRLIVDEVVLDAPRLFVTRREDGRLNVEDLGAPQPEEEETPRTQEPPRDWLETFRTWYERIQKVRQRLPRGGKEPQKERGKKGKLPWQVDYSRGVTYPFANRPSLGVRDMRAEDLEVSFLDAAGAATAATLTKGLLRIQNVTDSPSLQQEPTLFELSGELAGSRVSVTGTMDLRGGKSFFELHADLGELPASLVEAFVGPSLPVRLTSGTVRVKADVILDGLKRLDVRPLLGFKDIRMEAKDPKGKIAGVDALRFTRAFNDVSKEISSVQINDLKIAGTLLAPEFHWGDTVRNIVTSGAKAFAAKKAREGIDKGRKRLDDALKKLHLPEDSPGNESGKRTEEKVEKEVEKYLPGLFGGKKK